MGHYSKSCYFLHAVQCGICDFEGEKKNAARTHTPALVDGMRRGEGA
jgi:hypothetical protein